VKQNPYDNPRFFSSYSGLPRSTTGLGEAVEWPAFRRMIPELRGRRVLDLGCGFGWHCRFAAEQGARSVLGVDLSEKMLARAAAETHDPRITYSRQAIEDIRFSAGEFDVVMSSLAFHYVAAWEDACRQVYHCLSPRGTFVFSVEHPIFTSVAAQEWSRDAAGERRHWPVDGYQLEGPRSTHWLSAEVTKYHRTTATYVNALVSTGFLLRRLEELPGLDDVRARPDWSDEARRPMFLVVCAQKPVGVGS